VITIFNDQPWVDEAVCSSVDPEIFYVSKGGSTLPAKLVCASCPVQKLCLQWALDTGERYSVLGGYSSWERRKLKRGGVLRPLPKPVERTEKRCAWCRKKFTGEQMYCGVSCSSSGTRHERLERLAEIRDAS
jgi:uncharacterized protein (UPF0179 family)